MQQQQKDIVKDISAAVGLENELRLSQAQHGVVVLDIYSSEWGNTKALSETFRRLYMDAGSQIYLRFYSVECNSVLESLNSPDEQRHPQRPKVLELCRDTLPTYWESILRGRRGKSKSFFVFYKEGTHRASIEGIDTPKIINCVKDLCSAQKPASECTSNKQLLEFWESYFSFTESEVFWEPFLRAVQHCSGEQRPLSKKEEATFAEVVGARDGKVRVEALDKWLEEKKTVAQAFKELPFMTKKEFVSPVSASPALGTDYSILDGAEARHLAFMDTAKQTGEGNGEARDSELALYQRLVAMHFQCPSDRRLVLLPLEEGEEETKECLKNAIDVPTLSTYLKNLGLSDKNIWALRCAAEKKVSSDVSLYGKLALVLLLSDSKQCEELIGHFEDFMGQTMDGTLMSKHPPLGFTAGCLCTTDAQSEESFYYCHDLSTVKCKSDLKEGDQVVLPPFSLLSSQSDSEEAYTVKVVGLPKVIRLAVTGLDHEGDVFTSWYAKFVVREKLEGNITLEFAEHVEDEHFRDFFNQYTESLLDDEENMSRLATDFFLEHQLELGQETEEKILAVFQSNEDHAEGAVVPTIGEYPKEAVVPTADGSLEVVLLTNDGFKQEVALPAAEGNPEEAAVSTADGNPEKAAVPTAEGNPEEAAVPTADGDPEKAAVPTADGDPEKAAVPTADEYPEEAVVPTADGDPEKAAVPTADEYPEETAVPTADEDPEKAAVPTADGDLEKAAVPTADEYPEEVAVPTANDGPEKAAVPTADGDLEKAAVSATDEYPEEAAVPTANDGGCGEDEL